MAPVPVAPEPSSCSVSLVAPHLSTMVKFTPAAVAAATNPPTTTSVPLGSNPSAPTVTFPSFPNLDADPLAKKVALRAAITSVLPHVASVPSRVILDVFSAHMPIALQAIDAECLLLCNTIRDAFLKPGHPAVTHKAEDFLNFRGFPTVATMNMQDRENHAKSQNKCLAYVLVSASATDLSPFHPSLSTIGPQSATFLLKLPTALDNKSSATATIQPITLNPESPDTNPPNQPDDDSSAHATPTAPPPTEPSPPR